MKFINLLKKELSELANAQMFISLIATVIIFLVLGNVMSTTIEKAVDETTNITVNISDRDNTELTKDMLKILEGSSQLKTFETSGDDYADILEKNDITYLVIIPEGFTDSIINDKQPDLISISTMTSSATLSNINAGNSSAVSLIEDTISQVIAGETGMTLDQYNLIEEPVILKENTVIDGKSAQISSDQIISKVSLQNAILPIIVFILIMLTSQTLMSAIANEKTDKTLETLLSAPVSRGAVLGAKMLAAAVVALLNAAVYMLSFSRFISNSTDTIKENAAQAVNETLSVDDAMKELGLTLGVQDYFLVGLQLFFTIMICLSVSLILGALVNDAKNTQSMIMPIMLMAMVPYMISMLTDVNELPPLFKIIVYAIPFTHTFSAIPNLMFGHTSIFFFGLIYQIIVFAICMFFALRLFMSDKIFTISLNFGQKSKYKKKKNSPQNDE